MGSRYLLFAYDYYYPSGGMDDCISRTDDLKTAISTFRKAKEEYQGAEVYDCKTGETYYTLEELEKSES